MLTFSAATSHRSFSLLGERPCDEKASDRKDSIYSSSESLSNHISENVLEALRKQLDNKGLKVRASSDNKVDDVK